MIFFNRFGNLRRNLTGGEEQQGEIHDRKQCAESMGVQINKDPFNTCLLENEPCLSPTLVAARLCKLLVRIYLPNKI